MKILPIALTVRGAKNDFVSALLSCEKQKKIPINYISLSEIKSLPYNLGGDGEVRSQDVGLVANNIRHVLRTSEGPVFVDATTCSSSLALLNRYKTSWRITDEVVEKLYTVVYDKENPEKAELVQDIEEALRLLEKYQRIKNIIYITATGYAFNFSEALSKNKKLLKAELPEFEDIIEIDPKKEVGNVIKSALLNGKTVVVHEKLFTLQPTLALIPESLPLAQRKKAKSRLKFVKD